ncbi:DUF2937 family protein [Pseudorhodobacter wandonensis]|jgi:hypothetical protein|uniref:DUF2937 family protein n=1 Tax=Pseudorhodobacter wandonensis TaxID=1120568 RepID=UPI0009E2E44C|nr:DUF2937 family protein [Pseudorhodobacter wandonensis]
MIGKALTLVGGLAGATALSQYPEFSQQYIQRLGGQVDALSAIVADFDRSATDNGLTRGAALDQLQGTAFLAARKVDMQSAFARFDQLSADLTFLRLATPIERITMPQRLADPATLNATWADFRPAVPLTVAGAVATALGFVAGWGAVRFILSLILWPFRRRAAPRKASELRKEPVVRSQPAPQKPPAPRAPNAPRKQPVLHRSA